jgi:hypothetical protein
MGATIEGNRTVCDGVGPRSRVTLEAVARSSRLRPPATLVVRARVNVVSGVTARAIAAAQGRALRSLPATLGESGPADQVEIKKADGAAAQAEEIG